MALKLNTKYLASFVGEDELPIAWQQKPHYRA